MTETSEQVALVDFSTMDEETSKLYKLDGRPKFSLAYPVALQHLLAMFTGNLAPILIIAGVAQVTSAQLIIMVQAAMFTSGIATLLNLYPIRIGKWFQIGANLPVVMGVSMTYVAPASAVAVLAIEMGYPNPIGVVLGALFVAAFFQMIIAFTYKYLRPFFPPLVIGTILISLGISLFTVGINNFGGGSPATNPYFGSARNMGVAFFVFFLNVFLQRFGKGLWKISSILIALVVGYIVALGLGMVDFSGIADAAIFSPPRPLALGIEFRWWAIAMVGAINIVQGLTTIGYTHSITNQAMGRAATNMEVSGAINADAIGTAISILFNGLPNTEFGQNAGLVALTKIINKWCIALCAFTLIFAGLFPVFGAILATIPPSVLGGAVLVVFAMIFTNGIGLVLKSGLSPINITKLTVIFGIGLGFAPPNNANLIQSFPAWLQFFFRDRVLLIAVVAVLVNMLFMTKEEFALVGKDEEQMKAEAEANYKVEKKGLLPPL